MAILVEHSKDWNKLYKAEAQRIKKAFGLKCMVCHIGATAIKNMPARPEIDILVVLTEKADVLKFAELGYIYEQDGTYSLHTDEMDYTVRFEIHEKKMRPDRLGGIRSIEPYLAIAMYLSENKEAAAAFAQKKREIAAEFENDTDAYQTAKKQLLNEIEPAALAHKAQRDKAAAYLPIGMCLGMSVGMCFGVATGNVPLGMCIGVAVGMCIGVALGAQQNNKKDKDRK